MKQLYFNRATLLKALRLCALLLIYAASQARMQAQSVIFNTNRTFIGDGDVFGFQSASETVVFVNQATLSVRSTDPDEAHAYGAYADVDEASASISLSNTGTLNVLADPSASESWAYGFNVDTGVLGNSTVTLNNSGSFRVTSSDSDYSYAAGFYVVGSNSLYGNSTITATNSGSMVVRSGRSFDNDSLAAGFYLEGNSIDGNSSITATNSGSVVASAGYSFEDNSEAYGVYLDSSSQNGNAVIVFSNSASGKITAVTQYADESSDAYGIQAESSSAYGTATTTISNAGSVIANSQSSYSASYYSAAVGIEATSNTSAGTATTAVTNGGSLRATASNSIYESFAYGIDASSVSPTGAFTTVRNTGSIFAQSGSTYSGYYGGGDSEAYGIIARSAVLSNGVAMTEIFNFGTIESTSGYSDESDSEAYGIYGFAVSTDGRAEASSTNNGSITVASGVADDDDSTAYGMYLESASINAEAVASVTNSGSIRAESGEAEEDSESYGIYAETSGATLNTVTVRNSGTIESFSAYGDDDSLAYGIYAVSSSGFSNGVISIENSGTLRSVADLGVGQAYGIYASGNQIEVTNSGRIDVQGASDVGIYAFGDEVTVTNTGGTILSQNGQPITIFANNTGTLNLNGISHIEGTMVGLGSNDTLNLNLLGVDETQRAAIETALNAAAGGFASFTAAGQIYAVAGFENFTLETTTFASLLSGLSGLDGLAGALDNITGDIGPELGGILTQAAYSEDPQAAFALLAGQDILTVLNNLSINQINQLGQNLTNRAMNLRQGSSGLDYTGLQLNSASMTAEASQISRRLDGLMAAASGRVVSDMPVDSGVRVAEEPNRMGAWISGQATLAEQDEIDGVPGYEDSTYGTTVGFDYKLSRNLAAGILAGISENDIELSGDGTIDGSNATVGVYAAWAKNGWHAEGLAAYINSQYTIERDLLGSQTKGETSGNTLALNLFGGYDFKADGWTFGPTAGVQYGYTVVDGYRERGGVTALNVGENTIESLQSILGFQISREFELPALRVRPQLVASWHHEFLNDSNGTRTSFVNVPAVSSFNVDSREPERDFAILGTSVTAVIPGLDMVTFFAGYNTQIGQDSYIAHNIDGGIKVEF